MTLEEIKLRRLAAQHLMQKADTQTVVKDLCGVQAQFLSHALHGLSIRCDEVHTEGLIKSWTNRGTMHLCSQDDLPLFLHRGRNHFLRPVDTMEPDAYLSAERKAYFSRIILSAIDEGICDRDALKVRCEARGMTDSEAKSIFDPWGGLIRAMCEDGRICHMVQQSKAYQRCPDFEPMEEAHARRELLRRYFTHFGPATIKDAAYFFGYTQKQIKEVLPALPLEECVFNEKPYYYIESNHISNRIPSCLFLAGFDQLMLGYEKAESLFLPKEHLRDIFTLSGIVRPTVLVNGTVAGWWNLKNRKLTVSLFENADRDMIASAAANIWPELKSINFE